MEPRRLFSRRSVIATVGALVARIVYPRARGVDAAASTAAPPLSTTSPRPAPHAYQPASRVTYVFASDGRLLSVESPALDGNRTVYTYFR